jgi:uncharacterized membrane protein YkoI
MMTSLRPASLLLALAASALDPAAAQPDDGHDRALRALRAGEIAPLPDILATVAERVPGTVIEVELERRNGRYVYEVEVLTPQGMLVETYVDAQDKTILDSRDSTGEFGPE